MKPLITLILFFLSLNIFSQEIVTNIIDNPIINDKINFNKDGEVADTVELPFWDDFSRSEIFPDVKLWSDSNVFINSNYVATSPSIRVATFDALNKNGELYPEAYFEKLIISDFLTSQPINLNYPGENTIYLSFQYLPQGLADKPEIQDSLMLEFYAPEEFIWNKVWATAGNGNKEFQTAILKISEEKYLKKGFRFRFSNYTSSGTRIYPSLAGNSDQWHIDYVYLNKNRNQKDTIFHDIAFNAPLLSFLNDYQAMPWEHFKTNPEKYVADEISVSYTNNDNTVRLIDSINFVFTDKLGTSGNQKLEGGSYNVPPANSGTLNIVSTYMFNSDSQGFGLFDISANIVTSDFDTTSNNTINYEQSFLDFYAYDDGTAEAGYGLTGTGTKYSSVAYEFSPAKSDKLKSIKIYFNRTIEEASRQYFWLEVRKQNKETGLPEDEPIYSQEGVRPEYDEGLNSFHIYELPETILLDDVFYIGWTQTTEDMLNIGLDKNTNSKNKLFYNINGTWEQSKIDGSIMIRPVFGEKSMANIEDFTTKNIEIYPNPAVDKFFIDLKNNNENYNLKITDITGKTHIKIKNYTNKKPVDISKLSKGIYFVKISLKQENIKTLKIIKL